MFNTGRRDGVVLNTMDTSESATGVSICRCGSTFPLSGETEFGPGSRHHEWMREHLNCRRNPWHWWPRENPWPLAVLAFAVGWGARWLGGG